MLEKEAKDECWEKSNIMDFEENEVEVIDFSTDIGDICG